MDIQSIAFLIAGLIVGAAIIFIYKASLEKKDAENARSEAEKITDGAKNEAEKIKELSK